MNELIFFATALIDFALVLAAFALGRDWLIAALTANLILVTTFAAKLTPVFGFSTNTGNIFYAAVFLASNLLSEYHGPRAARRSVWIAFASLLLFAAMGQCVLTLRSDPASADANRAMTDLFALTPRIALASAIAYVVAQSFCIWLFAELREVFGQRWLSTRTCLSTIAAQLVDSILFFGAAFAGTLPFRQLLEIMLVGFATKVIMAVLSSPYMHLARGADHSTR